MDKLPLAVTKRIWTKLFSLETDLRPQGSLKLEGADGYRIRIGDYRIVYSIDDRERLVDVAPSPTVEKCTVKQIPR